MVNLNIFKSAYEYLVINIFVLAASFTWVVSFTQSSRRYPFRENLILLFQEDFNNSSFKNAATTQRMTGDINPGGSTPQGRYQVLKEVRDVHQTF